MSDDDQKKSEKTIVLVAIGFIQDDNSEDVKPTNASGNSSKTKYSKKYSENFDKIFPHKPELEEEPDHEDDPNLN